LFIAIQTPLRSLTNRVNHIRRVLQQAHKGRGKDGTVLAPLDVQQRVKIEKLGLPLPHYPEPVEGVGEEEKSWS
ncbi:hypothetical protein, partial [Agrobacterium larrymoorei]|uniref:hypothetical protein n=1 Tax=Agrobacterium larrymoorei TaxID=160699 RepID=UPI00056A4186